MKRNIQKRSVYAALSIAVAVVVSCHADTCTDEELRHDVLEFLTTRCCGRVEARRVLTNEIRFDGNTNRLAGVLAEFAQTNDAQIAEWAMWQLKKYATPAQLPFLYSCATNPVLGKTAVEAALRIDGVTSNSVVAVENFFAISSHDDSLETTQLCLDFMAQATGVAIEPICSSNALRVAHDFSIGENCHYYCFDRGQIRRDDSYRYSRRRLAYLRQVLLRGDLFEFQENYVTNAINELVAYPEANLPD